MTTASRNARTPRPRSLTRSPAWRPRPAPAPRFRRRPRPELCPPPRGKDHVAILSMATSMGAATCPTSPSFFSPWWSAVPTVSRSPGDGDGLLTRVLHPLHRNGRRPERRPVHLVPALLPAGRGPRQPPRAGSCPRPRRAGYRGSPQPSRAAAAIPRPTAPAPSPWTCEAQPGQPTPKPVAGLPRTVPRRSARPSTR